MNIETKLRIKELYLKGNTIKEISTMENIPYSTVQYNLVTQGTPMRKLKGTRYKVFKARVSLDTIKLKEGTPEFDYFIGILATDGNVHRAKVALQFAENNKEILEHWVKFLDNKVDIKAYTRRSDGRTYYSVVFKNWEIADYLKEYGITEKKTFTLKLKYLNWNVLLGIFDGDGCLAIEHKTPNGYSWRFSICSASITFIEQLNDFFVSYGLHPIVRKRHNYYNISLGKKAELAFIFSNIYKESSYFLHRKYDKFWHPIGKSIGEYSVNSVKGRDNH